jgi:hypothetical protein
MQWQWHSSGASHWPLYHSGLGQVRWDLWWTKWQWGRFPLSTLVSPAIHSTDCLTPSSGVGTIGQIVADIPCGLSFPNNKKLH